MSALYLIGYGFFRFLVEFVRQPDEQFKDPGEIIGTVFYIFSMGQVLCFFNDAHWINLVFLCQKQTQTNILTLSQNFNTMSTHFDSVFKTDSVGIRN